MLSLAMAHSISIAIALFVSAAGAETWISLGEQGNLLREQGHCREAVPLLPPTEIAQSLYNHAVSGSTSDCPHCLWKAASIRKQYVTENLLGVTVDVRSGK
jgi:hypothetical protein